MKKLIIEGTKGAGKSTAIKNLKRNFESKGEVVSVCAPFAEANQYAFDRGYDGAIAMRDMSFEHNLEIVNYMLSVIKNAENNECDVLIYDRHWLTLHSYLFDGKLDNDTAASLWNTILHHSNGIPGFFIYCTPQVTIKRREGELDNASGLQSHNLVKQDFDKRIDFMKRYNDKFMASFDTSDNEFDSIVPAILKFVE